MTMDERVEAAESALMNSKMWPVVFAAGAAHEVARIALAAAFPELHGDKPTHWLAPMEATEAMHRAAAATAPAQEYKRLVEESGTRQVGAQVTAPVHDVLPSIVAWPAMRDAYLGKGDGE